MNKPMTHIDAAIKALSQRKTGMTARELAKATCRNYNGMRAALADAAAQGHVVWDGARKCRVTGKIVNIYCVLK